jgi:predicted porin
MKTASGIAIAAAAGLFATSAMAADLGVGGNCCADLEERIAELEATTARKGNRVVSLTVFGRITQGILWHDDEWGYREGKLTIRDDDASPTMFGFRGEAQMRPGLTAGYHFEFGVSADNGSGLGKKWDDDLDKDLVDSDGISIRYNYVYLDSETFGRVTLGHASQVTDGLYEISLANTVVTPGKLNEELAVLNDFLLAPWAYVFDGHRHQGVYYRSPTLAGFVFSAGYSHDSRAGKHLDATDEKEGFNGREDIWEVALRYAGEFNGVRIAAGIGYRHEDIYSNDPGNRNHGEASVILGSASIMHMPTGLFVSGGVADAEIDMDDDETDRDAKGFWVMAGIEKNFFGPGTTTLFAEYAESNIDWDDNTNQIDNEGKFWGLGVVQRIDAAATDLFLKYRNVDAEHAADDANVVIGGMRIQF